MNLRFKALLLSAPANGRLSSLMTALAELKPSRTCAPIQAYVALVGTALYGLLVAATVWHHEPWADEAQAWLLARDANLVQLWTTLLSYEGSPGLWHSLLYLLIRAGAPYAALNIASAVLGVVGAWLVLKHAPLPWWIKVSLPFTFFLCYQYVVIGRSYSLLPPLLFACAIIFRVATEQPMLFTAILCAIAAVSVHGFLMSACIWAYYVVTLVPCWKHFDIAKKKTLIVSGSFFLAALGLFAFSAWPPADIAFPLHAKPSLAHFWNTTIITLGQSFTGEPILSFLVISLSIPLLVKGRGVVLFSLLSLSLCAVAAFLHSQVWHQGLIVLGWLFAVWISAYRVPLDVPAKIAIGVVIAVQCSWTAMTIYYDWNQPYSGSLAAARYLHQQNLNSQRLHAVGYSSTALQPYFSRNPFFNVNRGAAAGYWDWSTRNTANDASVLFGSHSPDLVVVGYVTGAERQRWANFLALAGYDMHRHFDGYLFWRTQVFEAESFDLYRHSNNRTGHQAVTKISMGDSAADSQLLYGFHTVESNSWRWSERKFAIALGASMDSRKNGARLELHFVIPQKQIETLGQLTLSADVGGYPLTPQTFVKSGAHLYTRDVETDALDSPTVAVRFNFDKAISPSAGDDRELAAIITAVSLSPR